MKIDETPVPLCMNCLEPFDERRDFCQHCGAPVNPYLWLDPLKRIYGAGYVYRKLVGGRNRRSVYVVAIVFLVLQLFYLVTSVDGYYIYDAESNPEFVRNDLQTVIYMGLTFSASFILLVRIIANMQRDKPPELD